jgi:hypothetical protein
LTGGTLTISGTGDMTDFDSKEDAPWYNDRASIKTIIISEGVTSIGLYSFVDCSNLTKVSLPSTLTDLGTLSFWLCASLEKIDIPDSITEIPYGAFALCSSLKEINANNIQTINQYGFEGIGAESFTIGKTVTTIVSGAFLNCSVRNFYVEKTNGMRPRIQKADDPHARFHRMRVDHRNADPVYYGGTGERHSGRLTA